MVRGAGLEPARVFAQGILSPSRLPIPPPARNSSSILDIMNQIIVIHGGSSFSSYGAYRTSLEQKELNYWKLTHPLRWKERLFLDLPDYEVVYAAMPNSANAVYEEWCVYFEKLVPFLEENVQIIGHSLGAMFLSKYLRDNLIPVKARRIMLVAGGYDDDSNEDLGSFKVESAASVQEYADEVHLFHSKDDPVVPFTELAKYRRDLPDAFVHIFKNRNHFLDEYFPEIIELLKQK